jgi:hypothetical protein
MNKIPCLLLRLLFVFGIHLPGHLSADVGYDSRIPQLEFAANELEDALIEAGRKDLKVTLIIQQDDSSPEAFQIRKVGSNQVEVTGTDANGAMYGGLELADLLRLGLPIEDQDQKPFVEKRGIKFNIPWDARTPSYDDTGDSAQKNIETVWDFEFWREYIDQLARYRYNVLSLWSTQPYANLVKLDDYPEAIVEDVYRMKEGLLKPHHPRDLFLSFDTDGNGAIEPEDGTIELVKKMTIDEKIAHWQKVFNYAEDRGLEIYLFSWNVFTHGATGKHGITQEQDNPITIDYMRKSVRQTLLNYPQIAGIGVTAGENADRTMKGEFSKENYVFNTFGRGIMDVLEMQPDRHVRFIIRHMYSSRRPQEWEKRIVGEGWLKDYKVWLNLRNDDIFVHRWGSADYVRGFINWMPHDYIPGFYMGSDGYVWAREFVAKNPEMAGRLEIDKHWYNFRLWGQLAYNNQLGRDYWEAVLKHRFPNVDARLLYDAWAATSEIVPQVNRASWSPTDAAIAVEGCMQLQGGFLTVDDLFFDREPMVLNRIDNPPDPQCLSVTDWAQAMLTGKKLEGVTPLEIADNWDGWAATGMAALPTLRKQMGDNVELQETLNDIESMAYLGRYYADKIRGAAKLAVYRADHARMQFHAEAVAHLKDAVEEWKAYAAILTAQYKTQLLARTQYLDWNGLLQDVEKEVVTVQNEADVPELRFVNLKNGVRLPEGSELRVELAASDRHGIRELKLRMNGLLLLAHPDDPRVWSGSSDTLLKSLGTGRYLLEALAVDNTGISSRRLFQVFVGDASEDQKSNWRDDVYQVVLNEGERLMERDFRAFPRLECFVSLDDQGKLGIYRGSPGKKEGEIWGTIGKDDRPSSHPQFAVFEKGQLIIYRGTPEHPKISIYQTKKPKDEGSYKLGITVSKRLVVFSEIDGKRNTVWMSPVRD